MDILFSDTSRKQLRKLDVRIQQKIFGALDKFRNGLKVDVIKMRGSEGDYRIRVGNYRVQMQKVDEGFLVTKVGKRENFYLVFF